MKLSSVRPSVRLSVPSIKSSNGVRLVCCSAPCVQEISINSCGRRAAGAGAQQQMRAASRCQPTEEAERRLRFILDYFSLVFSLLSCVALTSNKSVLSFQRDATRICC